ncbi:MAG TPA: hypothetical protein VJR05_11920 [Acidimicrobiia bacterium]|nr:hypothetical protein [Acidimicrobiia bacterium]
MRRRIMAGRGAGDAGNEDANACLARGTFWVRHPIWTGAIAGCLWGVLMRLWMRYIATRPEFSWSGTGYIIGASTLVGLCLGVAWWRWRLGRGNWWRLWGPVMLLLGVGAGAIMIPAVLLGGLGWGRTGWPRWLRLSLVAASMGAVTAVVAGDTRADRRVIATLVFLALLTVEIWAASVIFRPSRSAVPAADIPAPLPADAGG